MFLLSVAAEVAHSEAVAAVALAVITTSPTLIYLLVL